MTDRKDIQTVKQHRDITSFTKDTRLDPFGQNISSARAYARAERIAAAIYLVTKSVPETESVKSVIRAKSHDLMKDTMRLSDGFRSEQHPFVRDITVCARELVSLLRLLLLSGYVSSQNTELIVGALDDLVSFIVNASGSLLSERVVLSKNDLTPEDVGNSTERKVFAHQNQSRNISTLDRQHAQKTERGVQHESRREAILTLLRESGELGIKDIASHIVGCSEKTVQRELATLTNSGVISKTGEKRWSRYALVEK